MIIIEYTAVIIAYRQPAMLAAVMQRLAEQTMLPQSVLIVDNGGTITAPDVATFALASRTTLIPRPDNPGYGPAVNEARGRCAEAVLVLTHDAVFLPTLAEHLSDALVDEKVGASAPVLRWASSPDKIFSAGGFLTRGGRGGHLSSVPSNRPYPVDWVDGAIVLYRTAALDTIEWLSEDYFLYFEDVDTAWRMRERGFLTVVAPRASALQQPGAHPMYLGIRNMTLFAVKARIPRMRSGAAVTRRVVEESIGSLLRGRSIHLIDAWRGWRDGNKGISGKPVQKP